MASDYFHFRQFTIHQDRSVFKVGTDGVLLGACADVSSAERILDIGTGTGLIALMLAQRSNARIVAIEPDKDSYLQACENTVSSPWNKRIEVVNSDFQSFSLTGSKFDLIVTNPPFFTGSMKNPDLRKSAARHDDNLTASDILEGSARLLSENGLLQLILPFTEGNLFISMANQKGFHCNTKINIKPLPGSKVKRLILGFSMFSAGLVEKDLVIGKGPRHEFAEEYIKLTKEFYLKF
jgi:tRNA1Val (adenine37-N6)-methyltransferase